MKYKNIADLFFKKAARLEKKVLMRYKTHPNRPLEEMTWREVRTKTEEIAAALSELDVKKADKVGLLSLTCHHWMPCDIAILALGACTVPMYHNSTGETIEYIVRHAEIEVVIVQNKIQLQKLRAAWKDLPNLRYVIVMEDRGDIPKNDPKILTLDMIQEIGREVLKKNAELVTNQIRFIERDDLASIIYTSGTTGTPKGVVLTHRNFLVAALSFYQYVPLEEGMNMLSFLPLAHIFERVAGQVYGLDQGVVFTYCEKVEMLPKLMLESDCHIVNVVPRLLEKMHAKIILGVSQKSTIARKAFDAALALGIEYQKKKLAKEPIDWELELKHSIAYKTILSKVKAKIAPNLKIFVVGGAPFSKELSYFFLALGFAVVEGYGLTETSAPITVNPPWANKPGTVGIPFSHFEVKIAEDGEIICRGESVFQGYFKDPETTSECIDKDGWFHTGDLGSFDEDGYLSITGRKKDIIVTAGGKNVAPQKVEVALLQSMFISQAIILGEQEKYLAALIVPDRSELKLYLKDNGLHYDPKQRLCDNEEANKLIEDEVAKANADLDRHEQIKAFHLLDKELTIDGGELTPTLKVRRNIVREKYKDIIKPLFNRSKKK
ncbi:MAG: long-chain fatty acid--CoA ligase [Candidatus Melainabacteria bacterium]|nr:long-chain fatty acid--CoA ligase [Candidatus Melainabacteria bacterium]